MMTARTLTAFALATLLAAAGGCTSDAPANDTGGESSASSTFNVSLSPIGESGVQGLTTVSPGPTVTFKLELMGLTSGETYTAALHAGTCESPGAKVADLNTATSGAIGIGSSVTPVERDAMEDADRLHVQAHLPDGTLAACGDVPADRLP